MAYVAVSPIILMPQLFGLNFQSSCGKPISAETKDNIKRFVSENLFKQITEAETR